MEQFVNFSLTVKLTEHSIRSLLRGAGGRSGSI